MRTASSRATGSRFAFTAIEVATVLGKSGVKLVLGVAVGGGGGEGALRLADVLIGRMLASGQNGLGGPNGHG